jgi:hypothetical protein
VVQVLQYRVQDQRHDERYERVPSRVRKQASALLPAQGYLLEDRQSPLLRVSNPESHAEQNGNERLQDEAELKVPTQEAVPPEIVRYVLEERHDPYDPSSNLVTGEPWQQSARSGSRCAQRG